MSRLPLPCAAMRTTLDIDDTVLAAAKELARARGQTTGLVISELARKGMEGHRHLRQHYNPFPVFDVPAHAEVLTIERVEGIVHDEGLFAGR